MAKYLDAIILILVTLGLLAVGFSALNLGCLIVWILIMGILSLFILAVSFSITKSVLGFLIDERNKMSMARFQMTLWTIVVLSAFMAAAFWNLTNNWENPLSISIPSTLWLLMGISTASLIGSPLMKANKKESNKADKIHVNDKWEDAEFSDIFKGEEKNNFELMDFAKVQMFFFTVILLVAYVALLSTVFQGNPGNIVSFPILDESMIALLGISHGGYLINKAVPRP